MSQSSHPLRLSRRACLGWIAGGAGVGLSGCVNVASMVGKMLLGDPMTTASYTVTTGVDLVETQSNIVIHVSAPSTTLRDCPTLTFDLEQELHQRCRHHEVQCIDQSEVSNILDAKGLNFDPDLIARGIKDVDFIFRIHIENFSIRVENSPNLLQGIAHGTISGYQVEGGPPRDPEQREKEKKENPDRTYPPRTAVQNYEKEFQLENPRNHPIPVDQTPAKIFLRRFVTKLAEHLGNQFYPVKTAELI
jgi:hypothetical protein